MIQLTDKLFAVPVPEDAKGFSFGNHCLGFKSEAWIGLRDRNNWCLIEMGLFGGRKHKILGTVSKDTIDFDVACLYNISPKAFRSLLTSKGCNPDEKHLIIEKI